MFHVFTALAEFERDIIRARTHARRARSRSRSRANGGAVSRPGTNRQAPVRATGHDSRADRGPARCQQDHGVPGTPTRKRAGRGPPWQDVRLTVGHRAAHATDAHGGVAGISRVKTGSVAKPAEPTLGPRFSVVRERHCWGMPQHDMDAPTEEAALMTDPPWRSQPRCQRERLCC